MHNQKGLQVVIRNTHRTQTCWAGPRLQWLRSPPRQWEMLAPKKCNSYRSTGPFRRSSPKRDAVTAENNQAKISNIGGYTTVIRTHDGPKNNVFLHVHTPSLILITMLFPSNSTVLYSHGRKKKEPCTICHELGSCPASSQCLEHNGKCQLPVRFFFPYAYVRIVPGIIFAISSPAPSLFVTQIPSHIWKKQRT